jgi:hypothetical protein
MEKARVALSSRDMPPRWGKQPAKLVETRVKVPSAELAVHGRTTCERRNRGRLVECSDLAKFAIKAP